MVDRFIAYYSDLVGTGDMVVISGDASNQKGTGLQEKLIDIANARVRVFASMQVVYTLKKAYEKSLFWSSPIWMNSELSAAGS